MEPILQMHVGPMLEITSVTAEKWTGVERAGFLGALHSVILKFELSLWISYFNPKVRVNYLSGKLFAWVFFAQQDPVTLSLFLRSVFSKTENPALILTDRSCIQTSAWVNICTSLFFGQPCCAGGKGWWGSSDQTGRETSSAWSGPFISSWLYNRWRGGRGWSCTPVDGHQSLYPDLTLGSGDSF